MFSVFGKAHGKAVMLLNICPLEAPVPALKQAPELVPAPPPAPQLAPPSVSDITPALIPNLKFEPFLAHAQQLDVVPATELVPTPENGQKLGPAPTPAPAAAQEIECSLEPALARLQTQSHFQDQLQHPSHCTSQFYYQLQN